MLNDISLLGVLPLEELCLPSNLCFEAVTSRINRQVQELRVSLALKSSSNLKEVLAQVSLNSHKILKLGIFNAQMEKDEAMAIVTLLPNVAYLFLKGAKIDRNNLVTILQGCKQLVHLDVGKCIGFDEDDDEILKLVPFIPKFMNQGSKLYDYDHDDDYYWAIDHGTDDFD